VPPEPDPAELDPEPNPELEDPDAFEVVLPPQPIATALANNTTLTAAISMSFFMDGVGMMSPGT